MLSPNPRRLSTIRYSASSIIPIFFMRNLCCSRLALSRRLSEHGDRAPWLQRFQIFDQIPFLVLRQFGPVIVTGIGIAAAGGIEHVYADMNCNWFRTLVRLTIFKTPLYRA